MVAASIKILLEIAFVGGAVWLVYGRALPYEHKRNKHHTTSVDVW